jgi:hypothetical protein
MRRRIVVALGATVLAGLLASCTGANSGSSGVPGGVAANQAPARAAAPANGNSGGSAGSAGGQGNAGANQPPATAGRQVIRSATVAVTTNNVSTAAARAEQIATGAGGYLSGENVNDDSATVTLSVPENQLDGVLAEVGKLGKVTSQQEQSQDVTDQLVDVTSRIATQQASVDRVRQLLAQAKSISDVVQIEDELTKREADLESMEHQQDELTGQVAMSTVNLQLDRTAPPPPSVPAAGPAPGFGSGIAGGWHALGETVRVVLLVLGAALPFLLGIGIPALVVWWFVRRRRTARAG